MSNKIGTCRTTLRDSEGRLLFALGETYTLLDDGYGGYAAQGDDGSSWAIYEDNWGGRLHAFTLSDPPQPRPTDVEILNALGNGLSIATDLEETGGRVCTARKENIEDIIARLKEG